MAYMDRRTSSWDYLKLIRDPSYRPAGLYVRSFEQILYGISASPTHMGVSQLSIRSLYRNSWLAVKKLRLSYHNPKTILFTVYPYYGNLN